MTNVIPCGGKIEIYNKDGASIGEITCEAAGTCLTGLIWGSGQRPAIGVVQAAKSLLQEKAEIIDGAHFSGPCVERDS